MTQRLSLRHAYRSKHSSRLALSVPIELKREMAKARINWSLVFQVAAKRRLRQLREAKP